MPLDKREPEVKAISAISSRMFEHMEDMSEHPAARQMQAEINRMQAGADALAKVKAARSPTDTPAAHAMKVAKLARQFEDELHASLKRTSSILLEADNDVQRRIGEKVDLRPSAFADEIRTVVRGMKPAERAKLIETLVQENNGPELGAIINAPTIITGLTEQERSAYRTLITERHAGAELAEGRNLEEVYQSTFAAYRAGREMTKRFSDPNQIAEIERAASEAAAASEAFNQSIQ